MAKAPPSLLEHAITAVENVHALTVGLAHAGANPDVLKQLGQCSSLLTAVVKALGSGPSLDNASGGGQQAAPAAPSPADAEADDSAGPPSGAPQAAPQPAAAASPAANHSFAAAASALQAAHAAANAKK